MYIYIYIYIYTYICTYIYIYLYIYHICTSCSKYEANVYADVYNICLTYTPAHAWCPKHRSKCMHTLRKNAYAMVHARICNSAEASLP